MISIISVLCFLTPLSTRKILWQVSLSDCYTRDPATGLFRISYGFGKRTCDINTWTFGSMMFEDFPDLYRVAPEANSIAACVRVEERGDEVGEREGNGVDLGVDSRGLKWHKNADKGKEVVSYTFW